MKIVVPDNNQNERSYILRQLMYDYLGLEVEIVFNHYVKDYQFVCGDKFLVIRDGFWNKFPKDMEYFSEKNIPQQVVMAESVGIKDLPIIYGFDFYVENDTGIDCGIDIFAGAFFMLSRWEEFALSREKTGKCREEDLIMVKSGMVDVPVVNLYIDFLVKCLNKLNIQIEKPDRRAVMITHDVDRCYLSSFRTLISNLRLLAFRDGKYKKAWTSLKNYLIYKVRFYNPFNPFEELMDYSERYGFKNAFYFKCCHEGETGYTYAVEDTIVSESVRKIRERGHEVGFHPSESTFKNDIQYETELHRLESVIGCGLVIGGRSHELLYDFNSYRQWNRFLKYDSGMGYQRYNGFRSGTCYSYRIFDIQTRQVLDLMEFPFVAMDTVIQRNGWTPDEAYKQVCKIIDIVEKYRGVFCLNWHSNLVNTIERKKYKQVYFKIIDYVGLSR